MHDGRRFLEVAPIDVVAVPGVPLDPPPKDVTIVQQRFDERHVAAGLAFRASHRFFEARAPLLTAGTTYYAFLAMISLTAFAYGAVALIGADQVAQWLTSALNEAFPGLVGTSGISPEAVRGYGTAASTVGLVFFVITGTSAVHAAGQSLHLIFGAPKDPRDIVTARLRMLWQLFVLAPLILASMVPSLLLTSVSGPLDSWRAEHAPIAEDLSLVVASAISLSLSFLIVFLILSWLGGIRPPRRPRLIGAACASLVIEVLKYATAGIIAWSLSKPQYGAFAAPITIMLLLYLLTSALYAGASLTAAIAVREASRPTEDSGTGPPGPE